MAVREDRRPFLFSLPGSCLPGTCPSAGEGNHQAAKAFWFN